jgi:hypothetical protein
VSDVFTPIVDEENDGFTNITDDAFTIDLQADGFTDIIDRPTPGLDAEGFLDIGESVDFFPVPKALQDPAARQALERNQLFINEDSAADIESALYLSDALGITPEEAYAQLPAIMGLAEQEQGVKGLEAIKAGWQNGVADAYIGNIGWRLVNDVAAGNTEGIEAAMEQIEKINAARPAVATKESGFFARMFGGAVRQVPRLASVAGQSLQFGFAGAATGGLAAAAAGAITGPGAIATGTAGFVGGFAVGQSLGMKIKFSQQMIGTALVDFIDQGMSPAVALGLATPVGILNGLIESAQFSKLKNLLPGGARGLAKIMQNATGRLVGEQGALAAVAKGGVRIAGTYAQEMTEEMLQQAVEVTGEAVGVELENYLNDTGLEQTGIDEILTEFGDVFEESALTLAPLVLIPGLAGTAGQVAAAGRQVGVERVVEGEPVEAAMVEEEIPIEEQITPETPPERAEVIATEELQTDIDELQFETEEEFLEFAHSMYDEAVLPDDAELLELFEGKEGEQVAVERQTGEPIPIEEAPEDIAAVDAQIREDAAQADTADEFVRFAGAFYDEAVTPSEEELRAIWEEAHPTEEAAAPTRAESQQEFTESVESKEGVEGFLGELGVFIDSEMARLRDTGLSASEAAKTLGNLWDHNILANARRVKAGRSITERSFKSIRGKLQKDPDHFRLLMAQLEGDQEALQLIQQQTEEAEPVDISQDPAVLRAEQAITEEERAAAILAGQEIPATTEAVKTRVRRITGQTSFNRLVAEDKALGAAIKKAEQGARKAMSEGKRVGVRAERDRKAALIARQREIKVQRERVQKMKKDIIGAVKRSPKLDPIYKEEIENLTNDIDLVIRRQPKTLARLERTSQFLLNNPESDLPERTVAELSLLSKTPFGQMSPNDMETIHDGVMTALALNDQKTKLKVRKQEREFSSAVNAAVGELKPAKPEKRTFVGPKKRGTVGNAGVYAKNLVGISQSRPDVVVDRLFGAEGVGHDVFSRQIEDGVSNDLSYRQGTFQAFKEELGSQGYNVNKDSSKWIAETVEIQGDGKVWNIERGHRISIFLHTLDEDNYESMLTGVGFRDDIKPNTVHQMTEKDVQAIVESMDDDERAWAEAARATFRQTGQDQQAEYLRQNWYEPVMRENYMRKDVMPASRTNGMDVEAENFIADVQRTNFRVGVDKSQLIERQDVRLPIFINNIAHELNDAVLKASAYVNLEAPLKNAHKLLMDRDLKAAVLAQPNGEATMQYLNKYLRDVAGENQAYGDLTKGVQKLRGGVTKYALGANVWVAAKQALSYPFAAMYVKPKYLMLGATDEAIHPKKSKEQHEVYSPGFVERTKGGFSRDIAEVMKKNTAGKTLLNDKKSFGQFLLKPSQHVDARTVSGVMNGAVRQAMDEFAKGKLSKEVAIGTGMSIEEIQKLSPEEQLPIAYKFADYAVGRTQPMFSPAFLSQMQRGSDVEKLITQFSSFTNQELNMMRRAMNDAKNGDYKKLALFATSFMANGLGIWALDRARDKLRGRDEEDIKNIGEVYVDSAAGMYYGVRDIQKAVSSQLRGRFGDTGVQLPAFRIVDESVKGLAAMAEAFDPTNPKVKREKALAVFAESALDVLMLRTGIPYVLKSNAIRIKEALD